MALRLNGVITTMDHDPVFAVGSTNPVKVACVTGTVVEFWPGARAIGVASDSGVSDQPLTEDSTLAGATNRAHGALAAIDRADFGVGLEGGVIDRPDGMWAFAWAVVVSRDGTVGKGKTGQFLLPEPLARMVREGLELGEADDRFFGCLDSKRRCGAIGLLSDGRIERRDLYRHGLVFALLPFVHPEYYRADRPDSARRSRTASG